jgi:hypothetical protein
MEAGKGSDKKPLISRQSRERIFEAEASWVAALLVFFATVYSLLNLDVLWVFFGISALTLYILPILTLRDPFRALPWEMTVLMAAPLLIHISGGSHYLNDHFSWWENFTSVAFAFSIATLGFLLTIELEMYTSVKMNRPFAVFFVVMFTLAVAGFWQVGEFIGDEIYGTSHQGDNTDVMLTLVWNLVGGVAMGFVYYLYLRAMSERRRSTLGFIHLYEVPKW